MSSSRACFSLVGGFPHIFACITVFHKKIPSFLPRSSFLLLVAVGFSFISELIHTM